MDETPMEAPEETKDIIRPRLIRVPREDKVYPAAIYAGEKAPRRGSSLTLVMANGSRYVGIVFDATACDGEVLVEFRDGLTPVR